MRKFSLTITENTGDIKSDLTKFCYIKNNTKPKLLHSQITMSKDNDKAR